MSGLGAVIRSWEDEGGVTDPKQFLGNKKHDFFRCSGPGAKNGLSAKNRLATSTILLMAFGSLGIRTLLEIPGGICREKQRFSKKDT